MIYYLAMVHPFAWVIHGHSEGLRLRREDRNLQRRTLISGGGTVAGEEGCTYYIKSLAGPQKGVAMPVRRMRVSNTSQRLL